MRRVVSAVVAVAVHLGAISAPVAHVHLDDHATDHHHGRERHAHFAGHHRHTGAVTPGEVALTAEDPEQRLLDAVFVAVPPDAGHVATPVETQYVLLLVQESSRSLIPPVAHGHDPPLPGSIPSRAPPRPHLS